MIVAKFGGTCMISRNLNKVKSVLTDNHRLIVVSAQGKRFDGDIKVTDLLYRLHESGYNSHLFNLIAKRYKSAAIDHAINIDIDRLLYNTFADVKRKNVLSYTVSIGEQLSAQIMAAYLNADYFEAEKIVRFCNNRLDVRTTLHNIKSAVENSKRMCVMGGFYGGQGKDQRHLFGRGGSDISGALAARALDASIYENWTDVNGLCVANPRLVNNVRTVECVSYNDMYVLSYNGAEVLHPDSIKPVQKANIPIHIRNIYNPYSVGTVVSNASGSDKVIGVTSKQCGQLWRNVVVYKDCLEYVVTTVLENLSKHGISVWSVSAHDNYAAFDTSDNALQKICSALLLTN